MEFSQRERRARFYDENDEECDQNLDRQQKKFMILLGHEDKKAFVVQTDDKKVFPIKDTLGKIVPLADRYKFVAKDDVHLYWRNNKTKLWDPIVARFKGYAATREIADGQCKMLAKKLSKPETGSTISGSTSFIMDNVNLSHFRSSTPDGGFEALNDSMSSAELTQTQVRFQQVQDRQRDLKRLAESSASLPEYTPKSSTVSASSYLGHHITKSNLTPDLRSSKNCKSNLHFESNKEVVAELKSLHTLVPTLFEEIADMKKEITSAKEKIDDLQTILLKQTDLLKDVKHMIMTKKAVEPVQIKEKLLEDDDDKVNWLAGQVNIAPFVNASYAKAGRVGMDFIKELAKGIYGDLLAVYKFNVQRNYDDRNQRKSLEQLDPHGKKIITYVLDKYYQTHSVELKNAETQHQLTLKEFHDYANNAIDQFGSLANHKRHRKEIYVTETLFYQYVIEKNMKPTESFSEDDREHLVALYDDLKVRKQTHKEAKKKRPLLIQSGNAGKTSKKRSRVASHTHSSVD